MKILSSQDMLYILENRHSHTVVKTLFPQFPVETLSTHNFSLSNLLIFVRASSKHYN